MTDARETRTRNLHEKEHALFDVRNSREKYIAASRYDTSTSFSRKLTHTGFSYVCHGLKYGASQTHVYDDFKFYICNTFIALTLVLSLIFLYNSNAEC